MNGSSSRRSFTIAGAILLSITAIFVSAGWSNFVGYRSYAEQTDNLHSMRNEMRELNVDRSFFLSLTRHVDPARTDAGTLNVFEGFFLFERGQGSDLAVAADLFEVRLAHVPGDGLAWAGLGLVRWQMGEPAAAHAALDLAQLNGSQDVGSLWPRAILGAQLWSRLTPVEKNQFYENVRYLWFFENHRQLSVVLRSLPDDAYPGLERHFMEKGEDNQAFERFWTRSHRG